jgi:hypothetical protein
MTNQERIQKYKEEVESVFYTDAVLKHLDNYDEYVKNGDTKAIESLDQITLGRDRRTYWVKFEIKKPDLLNSFLLAWVLRGKSIAGVKGTILSFDELYNKKEMKEKFDEFLKTL